MHKNLLYAAYGWLLLAGVLHFAIDAVSQYLRGKRVPGPEATLYYGLNTTYAMGQVLFALLALLAIRKGLAVMGQWPGVTVGLTAAADWLAIGIAFLEYREPRP
jgi:hypothetical protein